MKQRKNLNTAVKITDKGGNTYIYDSIEKAAEMTTLSVAALKIRANKNSVPKDGIKVEWVDIATKRHFMAKHNKSKGNQLELDIVHKLNDIGYNTCSSRSNSKLLDNAKVDICDLDDTLDYYIQSKCTQSFPSYFKIREECPLKDKNFHLIWKKQEKDGGNSPGTVAIIPIEDYWELLTLKLQQKKLCIKI